MTWWTEYQARRGADRKSLYVNNMKNTISTEFKNSTSYNLVKINDVDRDVRIVEESAIIKNPNKKRLLCYPDETISIGNIVLWDSENWICTETDTTSQVSDVGIISKSNNTLTIHKNNTSYQIPCIISKSLSLNTEDNKYIETVDNSLFLTVSNTSITQQINVNDIYRIGKYNYYISSVADDISQKGLLIFKMKYSEVEQEEHVYTLTILNNDNLQIAQSQSLTINAQLTDNGEIVDSPNLIYSSSDDNIATIDEDGIVSIVGLGSVVISVYMESNEEVSDSINVEIIEDVVNNFTVEISGSNSIIKGYTSNYNCVFKNNGNIITQQSEFYLTDDDGISPTSLAQITSQDSVNNSCIVKGNSIGYAKLFVKNLDGSIVSDGFRIQIKNLF